MKAHIYSLVKFSILTGLVTSFIIFCGLLLVAYHFPDHLTNLIYSLKPQTSSTPLKIEGVAVIGDSQSDEYRADDNRGENFDTVTYNWVEILQKERDFDFGEWEQNPEPRRIGYEYNWARSGATARSMIESGQHTGVAQQIMDGEINVVIVYIGANDFAPFITDDGYEAIYNGSLSKAQLIAKQNRILAEVKTALDVILDAGDVRIIVATIPHWSNNFGVNLAFPVPEQRQKVTNAVNDTNDLIIKLADQYSIPILDTNNFYKSHTGQNNGSIVVGGVKLERLLINNNPKNMFLDDGIHPGTVLNALFANEIIDTLNREYGTNITPLSDQEILSIAGIKK